MSKSQPPGCLEEIIWELSFAQMTFQEKSILILRKYPEVKFKRGLFAWFCGVEFYGFNEVINATTKDNFIALFNDWESLSRALRDVLKLDGFKLPPENEAKRREKEAEFKKEWKPKNPEEAKEFETLFGE